MSELKPCPFCGGEARLVNCGSPMVVCLHGCCQIVDDKNSVEHWNTRPIEDELRAEIARLNAKLNKKYVDIENGIFFGKPITYWAELEAHQDSIGHADLIAQLATWKVRCRKLQDERRWIPVSERLPEYGEPSLTIYHTKNATSQITIRCLVEDRDDKLRVIWYDIENGLWVNGNNITHWMPLPPPPDDYVGDNDHEHDDRIL